MKYVVTIENQAIEVEVDGDRVRVQGRDYHAELSQIPGTPVRHLLLDGRSWIIPVEAVDRGQWLLQSTGQRYEVEVLDERTRHIRSLVAAGAVASGPVPLKAPMPGLVVRVLAEVGQAVGAGQGVLVLEAMKMENELKAAGPGVVEEIKVAPGQAVEKGTVLVTFRAEG